MPGPPTPAPVLGRPGPGGLDRRLGLLDQLEKEFADRGGQVVANNHKQLYSKASKLVLSLHCHD